MTFVLEALAAYCVVVGAITWAAMNLAEPGYQTRDGFKYGEPPEGHSDYDGDA